VLRRRLGSNDSAAQPGQGPVFANVREGQAQLLRQAVELAQTDPPLHAAKRSSDPSGPSRTSHPRAYLVAQPIGLGVIPGGAGSVT
jgi:hypothetical protein